jgi:4-hydroxy-tetrahydrodipicolinate reductase
MVLGARGKVGTCLVRGVEAADDLALAGAVDLGDDLARALKDHRPDAAIDFTTPSAVFGNVSALLDAGVHAVVGTTGLTDAQLAALDGKARASGAGCLVAANFALGAVLMMRFAEEAARHFPWVEIVERHHEHKLDAPSGTARVTAERIARVRESAPAPKEETETAPGARGGRIDAVPVHSLRLPGSVAHQEVWFGGPGEALVIRHDAMNREVFVPGVLLAVRRIADHVAAHGAGLVRGLEPLLWPGS